MRINENFHLFSLAKVRWWKMFAKTQETSKFRIIKVATFKFWRPDSVGVYELWKFVMKFSPFSAWEKKTKIFSSGFALIFFGKGIWQLLQGFYLKIWNSWNSALESQFKFFMVSRQGTCRIRNVLSSD